MGRKSKSKSTSAVPTPSPTPKSSRQRTSATYDEIVVPLLVRRSFHLPNNTPHQDWIQWMKNNHIIFGICFHHPLHPIETWERLIVFSGSIAFALVATNMAYICDLFDGNEIEFNPNHIIYSFTWGDGDDNGDYGDDLYTMNNNNDTAIRTFNITYGMILLWTFGCTFHSIFDVLVWNVSACSCFQPGGFFGTTKIAQKCNDVGSYVLVPFVFALLTLGGYSSYLRVVNVNMELEDTYEDDLVDTLTRGILGDYSFLIRFVIELILTWFVFFPLLSYILFKGWLDCQSGRIPLLGGRKYDKRVLEEQLNSTEMELAQKENVHHSYARF